MKALVLCAGFGKRLGALSSETPKPLLEVGPHAIVEHILMRLAAHGVRDVFINLHHRAEAFPARLGDGRRFGVSITYLHEATPLGTAGTSLALLARLNEDLLVHYGDILTDHDLGALVEAHRRHRAAGTLLLHQRAGSNSVVRLADDDRISDFIERPATPPPPDGRPIWVFSGICVLSPAAGAGIADAAGLDLPRDVFPRLVRAGTLFGNRLKGFRSAIDSPERLEAARAAYRAGELRPPGPARASGVEPNEERG